MRKTKVSMADIAGCNTFRNPKKTMLKVIEHHGNEWGMFVEYQVTHPSGETIKHTDNINYFWEYLEGNGFKRVK